MRLREKYFKSNIVLVVVFEYKGHLVFRDIPSLPAIQDPPEFIAMLKIHFIGLFQGHGLCGYYVSCKTFRTVMNYVPLAASHCKSERSVLALNMGPFR